MAFLTTERGILRQVLPTKLKRATASVLVGSVSGFIAGMMAGGIGSRVAMRIVALIAGREQYGRLTEAGETVGVISLDGTLFLLVASAIGSIPFGVTYVALRPFLPGRSGWQKGVVYGFILLTIFGSFVIDGDNFDFRLFVSPLLAVSLFALLFPIFGAIVGTVSQRMSNEGDSIASPAIRISVWTALVTATALGMSRNLAALQQIFR